MNVLGFFVLLAIAIIIRYLGRRYLALFVPISRTKTLAAGLVGGVAGQLISAFFLPLGPQVADTYIVLPIVLALFLVFLTGISPFLRVMFSRA